VRRGALCAAAAAVLAGCGGSEPAADQAAPAYTPPDAEPPVAVNAESPIRYPPVLYEQRIEGDVVLRLFVDSAGRLLAESTRVAESSGYPALDSAALAGAAQLRFAPARRRGIPVATSFLQPVEFRRSDGSPPQGGP
jgi:TonB family protein